MSLRKPRSIRLGGEVLQQRNLFLAKSAYLPAKNDKGADQRLIAQQRYSEQGFFYYWSYIDGGRWSFDHVAVRDNIEKRGAYLRSELRFPVSLRGYSAVADRQVHVSTSPPRLLHVRERADRYLKMGEPKSASGERTIPLPPIVVNALREHKLKVGSEFVFPTDRGNVQHHATILHRGFEPAQIAAKVVDDRGKPKYALQSCATSMPHGASSTAGRMAVSNCL